MKETAKEDTLIEIPFSQIEKDYEGQRDIFDHPHKILQVLNTFSLVERRLLILNAEHSSYRNMAKIMGVSVQYMSVKMNKIKEEFKRRWENW